MLRYAASTLILILGIEIYLSHGTEVMVYDTTGNLCVYAKLRVNFSVSYEVTGDKNEMARFELPTSVTSNQSVCSDTSSLLKLNFRGHSWSMNFTTKGNVYQAESIMFSYNLSDSSIFPNSTTNETKSVAVKPQITDVAMDTCYSCNSIDVIQADLVNQTMWDVLIQAFIINGTQSKKLTSCAADLPQTTIVPTSLPPNSTTAAPVTNTTSTAPPPPPTTTPTPTLPTPTTGNYSLSEHNSTACLLANFGLKIGFKQGDKYLEMNLDPNETNTSGKCGTNISTLVLSSNTMVLGFTFFNDTKKFHLHGLNVTAKTGSGEMFSESNNTLHLWETAVGSSFMCNKEQTYNITSLLTLYIFNLRVQPFGVKIGSFSTAFECSLDDTSILIPVIVGAALAGLIVIVVIAYVIGRRKTYVGYQTL